MSKISSSGNETAGLISAGAGLLVVAAAVGELKRRRRRSGELCADMVVRGGVVDGTTTEQRSIRREVDRLVRGIGDL
jgi:hypothetical protein